MDADSTTGRSASIKVYLVFGQDRKLLGAKLNQQSANTLMGKHPGAYIEKVFADKK